MVDQGAHLDVAAAQALADGVAAGQQGGRRVAQLPLGVTDFQAKPAQLPALGGSQGGDGPGRPLKLIAHPMRIIPETTSRFAERFPKI